MARIVPARPKLAEDMCEAALLELELLLDDEYIIFQNFPLEGSMLVCKLDAAPFVVCPIPEAKWIDFDTSNFVTRTNNFISFTEKAIDIKTSLELAKLQPSYLSFITVQNLSLKILSSEQMEIALN